MRCQRGRGVLRSRVCCRVFYELVAVSQTCGVSYHSPGCACTRWPPSWVSNVACLLSLVRSELERVFWCLRQLCCLRVKFCYPASGALVSFKHGAFLATLADLFFFSQFKCSGLSSNRFFACRLRLKYLFWINHSRKTAPFWLMGENTENICNTKAPKQEFNFARIWAYGRKPDGRVRDVPRWERLENCLLLEWRGLQASASAGRRTHSGTAVSLARFSSKLFSFYVAPVRWVKRLQSFIAGGRVSIGESRKWVAGFACIELAGLILLRLSFLACAFALISAR